MSSTVDTHNEKGQFVSFKLNDLLYGLDIRIVKEINPTSCVLPVPLSSPWIMGLVNIRGQAVLVLDISLILGQGKTSPGPESHIIILKSSRELALVEELAQSLDTDLFGNKPVAFMADSINEVAHANWSDIEMPPTHIELSTRQFYQGVVNDESKMLILLNAERILASTIETVEAGSEKK